MQKIKSTAKNIIDGNAFAQDIRQELKAKIDSSLKQGHRPPGLAVLLIGDNPASKVYVKNKVLACQKTGIESFLYELAANTKANDIFHLITELNTKNEVDGILVQLPLPSHLPSDQILDAVSPKKDADGLHPLNLGLLFSGKKGLRPCTPRGIIELLERSNINIAGKHAVVIGRSNLVGKPIAAMLLEKNATVTICHSQSQELANISKNADILVVAAGKKEMVNSDWVKPGAIVIDVGIHKATKADGSTYLCGDVLFEDVVEKASLITPVPGGVGPMTVAMLLSNTFDSYLKHIDNGA